jgi:hypothetical protein
VPENKISLLKVHEWLVITVMIGIITGLACLTSFSGNREVRKDEMGLNAISFKGFDVLIKGAVERPGIYHLEKELSLKHLLTISGVCQNADLRRMKLDTIVKKGRVINVPAREMITVHLKGAVTKETALILPKGSKAEDLLKLVEFTEDADWEVLKKKRRLKDGEEIVVPVLD